MSEHKHALLYEDNYGILTPVRLKCTVCGKRFKLDDKGKIVEIK